MNEQLVSSLRMQIVRSARRPVVMILPTLIALALPAAALAQAGAAALRGLAVDETGAGIGTVTITVKHLGTGLQRQVTASDEGSFAFALLPPGEYMVMAQKEGFAAAGVDSLVLNVGDEIAISLRMKVAPVGESVTVSAQSGERINTSPAVGTVIDRQFVETLPLNGRSFQSLLELTPGVVLTKAGGGQEGGQFSVNGQRSSSNYFTVDGVSANAGISTGISANPGQSGAGQLPALTALGGTNGLVSVDALQEFRIQTSSYAAEFGRMPGGQVSLVTRSGTNVFHGTVFEYFRDDAMDATDWFTNSLGQPQPQLNQHDFGGVLGGPIMRNRTFFFASYEGLRLDQPSSRVVAVPALALRRAVSPALKPYLDAFPVPNGADHGNGSANFGASYSDSSRVDSTSVRVDHTVGTRLTLFGRVSHAPTYKSARSSGLATVTTTHQDSTSLTLGSTWIASNRTVQDLRVNYTTNRAPTFAQPDDFGGAVPLPASVFEPGRTPENAYFLVGIDGPGVAWGKGNGVEQRQLNIVGSLTLTHGSHEWKLGGDVRRIDPLLGGGENPVGSQQLYFTYPTIPDAITDGYFNQALAPERRRVAFDNWSLYGQDTWRLTSRLTLTYGLRWELVPPPRAGTGQGAVTLEGLDNPYGGQLRLAPRGTPLWATRYNNVAPRVGGSYLLSSTPGAQMVIRGGFGMFHDLGFGQVANAFVGYPFVALKTVDSSPLPLTAEQIASPEPGSSPPGLLYIMDRHLRLPRTYQWNASVEHSFGPRQTLTVSYVGAEGRDLLKSDWYNTSRLADWPDVVTVLFVNRNRGHSDYHALQVQFQRRLQRGLQSIASYTLGRARDTSSSDFAFNIPGELQSPEIDYGYADFDVRHALTAALTYQVPDLTGSSLWRTAARGWGVDLMLRARSGFPIAVFDVVQYPPESVEARPNVVPGQPFWIDDATVPGGRRLNRQAFTSPTAGTQGDLKRGSVRGFGASQVDLAVRRDFRLGPALRLQVRFELFNVLNTPNFADPDGYLSSGTFGVSTQMLNRGLGGLSALYQIGGPRSAQIGAKLLF